MSVLLMWAALSKNYPISQERRAELNIQDIQLSLTPLEEVFLNVARQAELEYARNNAQFETLTITEEKNITIKVDTAPC